MGHMAGWLIGDVAKRTGVSAPTIRYYEGIGLLPSPARSEAGYRRYSDDTIEELLFIARRSRSVFRSTRSRRFCNCHAPATCHALMCYRLPINIWRPSMNVSGSCARSAGSSRGIWRNGINGERLSRAPGCVS